MNKLIGWIECTFEHDVEDGYHFIRIGAWSLGAGVGVFGGIAAHLESPWMFVAVEV